MTARRKLVRVSSRFTFCWTPAVELQLRCILRAHRRAPAQEDMSTPELLTMAATRERRLENEAIKSLLRALESNQPPLIDCDLQAAMERLGNLIKCEGGAPPDGS